MPFSRPPDDDWSSPAIGEDPKGALPATRVSTDPAVYLSRRFNKLWREMTMRHAEHRVTRASSAGPTIGHIRRVLIEEHGLSPEHIEAYFEAFVEAVAAGDVVVKEGQFAWQRFTGWWGTTDVDDPTERAQGKALAQWAVEQVRRQRGLTDS